jgi:hypothetical protein
LNADRLSEGHVLRREQRCSCAGCHETCIFKKNLSKNPCFFKIATLICLTCLLHVTILSFLLHTYVCVLAPVLATLFCCQCFPLRPAPKVAALTCDLFSFRRLRVECLFASGPGCTVLISRLHCSSTQLGQASKKTSKQKNERNRKQGSKHEGKTEKQTAEQTEKQARKQAKEQTEHQTEKRTDNQTEKQTEEHTEKQTGKQTEKKRSNKRRSKEASINRNKQNKKNKRSS